MKFPSPCHRFGVLLLSCALIAALSIPVSASLTNSTEETMTVIPFSKSGTTSEIITFSADDFKLTGSEKDSLDSVVLTSLPSLRSGMLMIGDQLLMSGDTIAASALNGIRFYPLSNPAEASTSFQFKPVFSSGTTGDAVKVNLFLLTEKNGAPVAENFEFSTYKNIAYSGQFSAVDPEGDLLTFQLVKKPARGSLVLDEEDGMEFIYTPYENKTGKDSFTYVAIDEFGNTSEEATVKIKIEKASTKVTYADMNGHPAYNAAIRLAEEKIFVGASMNGEYYFQPNLPVSRSEFLALAMSVVGMNSLDDVQKTGFFDDEAIATWAKPYVSSALKSGVITGSLTEHGQAVFRGEEAMTTMGAAVLLDRLLMVSDVPVETWSGSAREVPAWASQSVVNMESVGVLQNSPVSSSTLNKNMTRAEAAEMLSAAMDVLETREQAKNWFYK